jgi:hypothetical protein
MRMRKAACWMICFLTFTELLPSFAKGRQEDKGPNQDRQADDLTNNPLRHRQAEEKY